MIDVFQNIFRLPQRCLFHTVIPKNAFEKNHHLSATEKRLIATPYLPLQSILKASLVQSRSFISPYQDIEMDYEDILIFNLHLQQPHLEKYADKIAHLYQKYIPKPCVLLLQSDTQVVINTALKKYNEADRNKRVVTEQLSSPIIDIINADDSAQKFLEALGFENVDKENLKTLQQSYAKAIINYNTAQITGNYGKATDAKKNAILLGEIKTLESELETLRIAIKKTKSLEEKIEYKIVLNQKKSSLQDLKANL